MLKMGRLKPRKIPGAWPVTQKSHGTGPGLRPASFWRAVPPPAQSGEHSTGLGGSGERACMQFGEQRGRAGGVLSGRGDNRPDAPAERQVVKRQVAVVSLRVMRHSPKSPPPPPPPHEPARLRAQLQGCDPSLDGCWGRSARLLTDFPLDHT